jgi:hypothetical protein
MGRRIRSISLAASVALSSILGGGAAVLVPGVAAAASCSPSAALSHSGYSVTFTGSSTCTGNNLQSTTVFGYAQHCDVEGPFGICISWVTKYSWQKTCNYVSGNIIVCTKSVTQTVSLSGLWHTYMTSTTLLTSGGPITQNKTTDQYPVP